jgi:hypothetical protein
LKSRGRKQGWGRDTTRSLTIHRQHTTELRRWACCATSCQHNKSVKYSYRKERQNTCAALGMRGQSVPVENVEQSVLLEFGEISGLHSQNQHLISEPLIVTTIHSIYLSEHHRARTSPKHGFQITARTSLCQQTTLGRHQECFTCNRGARCT